MSAEISSTATDSADLPRADTGPTGPVAMPPRSAAAAPSKRTAASLVRFTAAEFRAVTQRAGECGLPPARFIREVALGAVPKARRAPANAELIRQLARAGTALQQLARGARERGEAPAAAALEQALAELLEAVRRVE